MKKNKKKKKDKMLIARTIYSQEILIFLYANNDGTSYVDSIHFQGENGEPLADVKIQDITTIMYKKHFLGNCDLKFVGSKLPIIENLIIPKQYYWESKIIDFIDAFNEVKDNLKQ